MYTKLLKIKIRHRYSLHDHFLENFYISALKLKSDFSTMMTVFHHFLKKFLYIHVAILKLKSDFSTATTMPYHSFHAIIFQKKFSYIHAATSKRETSKKNIYAFAVLKLKLETFSSTTVPRA